MGKNYYEILQIDRIANEVDVAKAFRKLSLKWHPKLSKEDQHTTYAMFCDIAESFEVLSDPVKRAMYDKYGEEKLKDGFFQDGGFKGGYRFGGKPEEIFEQFFGSNNPFEQICDLGNEELGSMFGFAFGGQNYRHADRIPNLEVPVDCTLNELYNGCSKFVTYKRQVLNADGRTTREATEKKEIEIKRGSNSTSSVIFEAMGNEAAGLPTSDLVFKLKELPHSHFKRKGDDLVYTAKVTLLHALLGEPLNIMTLDSRKLYVSMDEIINPKTVKRVEGEGMPLSFEPGAKRGDLFIKFDISFPKEISPEHKEMLKDVLQQ